MVKDHQCLDLKRDSCESKRKKQKRNGCGIGGSRSRKSLSTGVRVQSKEQDVESSTS